MKKQIELDEAIQKFNQYLKENNIKIEDKYSFEYLKILRKCHLEKRKKEFCNGILDFIVKFYDYKYPAYKFNSYNIVYWDNVDNRIWNLKWFIEKDLKIDINKIPLYVTKSSIKKIPKTSTLYHVLNKHYNGHLYYWINECYPDIFTEKDFDINFIKQEFDSIEEKRINDVLHKNLKNIFYNNLNTDNVIKLNGMIPDWLIFGQELILIEYFGYYTETPTTSRQTKYMETYNNKINKYKKLPYKTFFIYPDDLNNNYNKLINKIDILKKEGLVYE